MVAPRRNRRLPPRLLPCLSLVKIQAIFGDEIPELTFSDNIQQFADFNWVDHSPAWDGFDIQVPGGSEIVNVIWVDPFTIRVVLSTVVPPGLTVVTVPGGFAGIRGEAGGELCPGSYSVIVVEPL